MLKYCPPLLDHLEFVICKKSAGFAKKWAARPWPTVSLNLLIMDAEGHMATDLVCKMDLDERHIKESLVYDGRRYYFCSIGCRAEFQRHPDDYVERSPTGGGAEDV
jgi:YHS domain-containing protein